jgi:hypothetical protein
LEVQDSRRQRHHLVAQFAQTPDRLQHVILRQAHIALELRITRHKAPGAQYCQTPDVVGEFVVGVDKQCGEVFQVMRPRNVDCRGDKQTFE